MIQRNRVSFVGGVIALVASGVLAWGQAPAAGSAGTMASGPAAEAQRSYAGLKQNILKAADKMPEADFQFKPTPEVRTFARVVNHVSEAQLRGCGAVNHTPASGLAKMPAETAGKAAIVETLTASFAECDKAFAALTDSNLETVFEMGPMKRSRIGLMWGTISHDNEQYATLALYLRLKGLVPPSSEK